MEYSISIRINFPKEITALLKKEKELFINEYGSGYKSEPHITLYLDRYTAEGFPQLLEKLRALQMSSFAFSLLSPKMKVDDDRHRNLYYVDVSNKERIVKLHEEISEAAIPYRSPLLREKTIKRLRAKGITTDGSRESAKALDIHEEEFDPHITLGEIDLDRPQATMAKVREDLKSLEDKEITASAIVIYFYKKEDDAETAELVDEIVIPFAG